MADTENLTPTEDLIVDLLTARIRLGEQVWTFETRVGSALKSLESRGIIGYKSGPIEKTYLAWFTDEGQAKYVDGFNYIAPIFKEQSAREAALHAEIAELKHELGSAKAILREEKLASLGGYDMGVLS